MIKTVAIVAPGNMGAGIGWLLHSHGARIVTSVQGRSPESEKRARSAGFDIVDTDDALVAAADVILSVLPPSNAIDNARRFAPVLARASRKPIFVDCNAIAPATALAVEAVIAETGAPFVDGGIIGMPPRPGSVGTRVYISGESAAPVEALRNFGLDVVRLEGAVGAASALKLSYAMLGKVFTGLGASMMLAADRWGVSDALIAQLEASEAPFVSVLKRRVPDMYSKAYRWIGEMEEIAAFLGDDDPGARTLLLGAAGVFTQIAKEYDEGGLSSDDIAVMQRFLSGFASSARARETAIA